MKEACRKYDLKKRFYLGPTTLDDSLALILANLSRVSTDMLVYDPFVGTASILIALTHFGAMCFGSDIDTRVLRGEMYAGSCPKGQKTGQETRTRRDIFENFKRYNLPVPELIRMDNHVFDRHITLQSHGTYTISETTNCCTMMSSGAAGSANDSSQGLFDAIVTDPPYGIRAGAKKSGTYYLIR
jgi:tRNA (guanine10-N2)-methyltransferase